MLSGLAWISIMNEVAWNVRAAPWSAPSGVVVTGAGGYIGGAIVSYLLEHTDVPRVHATVRGDVSSSRYAALRALDPSTPSSSRRRLHLYSANMAAPGAFDEACRHCSAVIHVAAPTSIRCRGAKRAQKVLIDPAIRGIYYLPAKLELWDVLSAGALSLGLSFVVTIFPARRAARMNPVEALRYE